MLTYFQAIALGALQGVTELFPISSLGHSIILPGLLHWQLDQNANDFLVFLVATHFATALVLFCLFWNDWKRIIVGIFSSLKAREITTADAKLGWLLIVSTIPAGLIGLLFQEQLKSFFTSPFLVAIFLAANGLMLLGAELLRKKAKISSTGDAAHRIASELSWKQSVYIGILQTIALIPGFSRTGATITGSLLAGLSHEDALRYSFLLATPIIGAAALLKLPELIAPGNLPHLKLAIAGAFAAGIAAYFSAKFLARYFHTRNLTPFAAYCLAAGLISLLLLRI